MKGNLLSFVCITLSFVLFDCYALRKLAVGSMSNRKFVQSGIFSVQNRLSGGPVGWVTPATQSLFKCFRASRPGRKTTAQLNCKPTQQSLDTRRNEVWSPDGSQYFSPAKLNLFLRILGRDGEGFHRLSSLFHTIDLGDTLTFRSREDTAPPATSTTGDNITCNIPDAPRDESNLIIRAIAAIRHKCGVGAVPSLDVDVHKRVPMQGGLGGGSSNAATTLYAVNEYIRNQGKFQPLSEGELIGIAETLGSDCAFFLSSGAALCTDRGQNIADLNHKTNNKYPQYRGASNYGYLASAPQNLSAEDNREDETIFCGADVNIPLLPKALYIFTPPVGLCTASVYKKYRELSNSHLVSAKTPAYLLEGFFSSSYENYAARVKSEPFNTPNRLGKYLVNDLEEPAFRIQPRLLELKNTIQKMGFAGVMMSGSGSTIFALGEPNKAAIQLLIGTQDWKSYITQQLWPKTKIHEQTLITKDQSSWYAPVPSNLPQ